MWWKWKEEKEKWKNGKVNCVLIVWKKRKSDNNELM